MLIRKYVPRKVEGEGISLAETILLVLYAAIAVVLMVYFVAVDDIMFILYSFIGFIALGVILSFANSYIKYTMLISIAFILYSAIVYYNMPLAVVYTIITILVLAVLVSSRLYHGDPFHMLVAFLAAFALCAVLFPFRSVTINVSILGYYLLVSAVLALFIQEAALFDAKAERLVRKWFGSVSRRLAPRRIEIGYIVAVLIMVLLISSMQPSIITSKAVERVPALLQSTENYIFSTYTIQNLCSPGYGAKAELSIMGNHETSVFIPGTADNLSSALAGTSPGFGYANFLGRFKDYSIASYINESTINFSTTIPDGNCISYVILAANQETVRASVTLAYEHDIEVTRVVVEPYTWYYGIVPQSIRYLIDLYSNELNQTAGATGN